jgi:hypothetical protein
MHRAEALQADPDELRRHLSIPYVMEAHGHSPAKASANRLHYHSPFRPDTNPSFDVWFDEDRGWRWGDYAESTQGGVIDLVKRFEGCSDGTAIGLCRDLLAELVESDWKGPTLAPRAPFDVPSALARLDEGAALVWDRLPQILHDPDRPALASVPASWIIQEFQVSGDTEGSGVLIPYYSLSAGAVCGVRVRALDGRKLFIDGSDIRVLYGEGRALNAPADLPVLLCEGETDTWAAAYHLDGRVLPVGVAGAGHLPDRFDLSWLRGRSIFIAFDGDEAGRAGARRWTDHLIAAGHDVRIVPLPSGHDIASLPPGAVQSLLFRARPVVAPPTDIIEVGNGYAKPRKDDSVPVSNWRLDVRRKLVGSDSFAYEGVLLPHGTPIVLPSEALTSSAALSRWALQFGGSWKRAGEPGSLLELLEYQSIFLPEGRLTRQVGYHDGDFVWPTGHIGTDDWTYVPPASKIDLTDRVAIVGGECERPGDVLAGLFALHRPDIMGPILAWLAVAPIRPLFDRFPILAISGGSGTGKTTLTERVLRTFSGSDITTNLSSTTPYAVSAFFATSNAVPIWFDEYRPGAREDARTQLDQLLRDCYTGQDSFKGGLTENRAEVTAVKTKVPVVVTGEDNFTETSHTDRMIQVRLTKQGRGSFALLDQHPTPERFAYTYLTWLLDEGGPQRINERVVPEGPEVLNDRQRWNLGVLRLGWELLNAFVLEFHPGRTLPPLDLSGIIDRATESVGSNPLLDAIHWAYEHPLADSVWSDDADEDHLYVSPSQLLVDLRRAGNVFTLPTGNERGVTMLLREQHGAESVRVRRNGGHRIRALRLPLSEILVP